MICKFIFVLAHTGEIYDVQRPPLLPPIYLSPNNSACLQTFSLRNSPSDIHMARRQELATVIIGSCRMLSLKELEK